MFSAMSLENRRIQVDICGENATALEFWQTQTLAQIHRHYTLPTSVKRWFVSRRTLPVNAHAHMRLNWSSAHAQLKRSFRLHAKDMKEL